MFTLARDYNLDGSGECNVIGQPEIPWPPSLDEIWAIPSDDQTAPSPPQVISTANTSSSTSHDSTQKQQPKPEIEKIDLRAGPITFNKRFLRTDTQVLATIPLVSDVKLPLDLELIPGQPRGQAEEQGDRLYYQFEIFDMKGDRQAFPIHELLAETSTVIRREPKLSPGGLLFQAQLLFLRRPTKMFYRVEMFDKKPVPAIRCHFTIIIQWQERILHIQGTTEPTVLAFNNNRNTDSAMKRLQREDCLPLTTEFSDLSTSCSVASYSTASSSRVERTAKRKRVPSAGSGDEDRVKRLREEVREEAALSFPSFAQATVPARPQTKRPYIKLVAPTAFVNEGYVFLREANNPESVKKLTLQNNPTASVTIRILPGEYHYYYLIDGKHVIDETPSFTELDTGKQYNVLVVESLEDRALRVLSRLHLAPVEDLIGVIRDYEPGQFGMLQGTRPNAVEILLLGPAVGLATELMSVLYQLVNQTVETPFLSLPPPTTGATTSIPLVHHNSSIRISCAWDLFNGAANGEVVYATYRRKLSPNDPFSVTTLPVIILDQTDSNATTQLIADFLQQLAKHELGDSGSEYVVLVPSVAVQQSDKLAEYPPQFSPLYPLPSDLKLSALSDQSQQYILSLFCMMLKRAESRFAAMMRSSK